jgi:hypothetical protein
MQSLPEEWMGTDGLFVTQHLCAEDLRMKGGHNQREWSELGQK